MEAVICQINQGGFNDATRKVPALAFIEKYVHKVNSLDLSSPFQEWFTTDCKFQDTDGAVTYGGEAIWSFMKRQFGQFVSIEHDIQKIWVTAAQDVVDGHLM